jgi:MFS family permease
VRVVRCDKISLPARFGEPTKDQWYAWWAAWLGWTLDAFDFTVFLLIMKPIADEFGVPVSDVAWILALTLWMRLLGAVGSGWLADRVGRKTPLMISIFWYSIRNFIAGFSPTLLMACWWMASNFILYYSIWALFATHLQADLKLTTMGTAVPFMIANIMSFLACPFGVGRPTELGGAGR